MTQVQGVSKGEAKKVGRLGRENPHFGSARSTFSETKPLLFVMKLILNSSGIGNARTVSII